MLQDVETTVKLVLALAPGFLALALGPAVVPQLREAVAKKGPEYGGSPRRRRTGAIQPGRPDR